MRLAAGQNGKASPCSTGHESGRNGDLSPALYRCINREAGNVDLIHVTAVYSWPTLSVARASKRTGAPFVLSPRGSLSPAALAWRSWKKRLFHRAGGTAALQRAAGFHATSDEEAADVKAVVPGAQVFVVPNGTDVPDESELTRFRGTGREFVHALPRPAPSAQESRLATAGLGEGGSRPLVRPTRVRWARCGGTRGVAAGLGGRTWLLAEGVVRRASGRRGEVGSTRKSSVSSSCHRRARTSATWLPRPSPMGHQSSRRTGRRGLSLQYRGCGWWVQADQGFVASAIGEALALPRRQPQRNGRQRQNVDGRVVLLGLCRSDDGDLLRTDSRGSHEQSRDRKSRNHSRRGPHPGKRRGNEPPGLPAAAYRAGLTRSLW